MIYNTAYFNQDPYSNVRFIDTSRRCANILLGSGKMTVFVSTAAGSKAIPVLPPSPPNFPRPMQPLSRPLPSVRHYHSHTSAKSRPAPQHGHSEGHTVEEDVILTRAKGRRSQICANMSSIATNVCVRTSIKNAAFVMNTPFYALVGSSNCTLRIKQGLPTVVSLDLSRK
uniref:Uncharacterized protein n=1 Tax=Eptatretus burgeri TaxID=7764 RepID=A0A8C4NCM4_EPTBU